MVQAPSIKTCNRVKVQFGLQGQTRDIIPDLDKSDRQFKAKAQQTELRSRGDAPRLVIDSLSLLTLLRRRSRFSTVLLPCLFLYTFTHLLVVQH